MNREAGVVRNIASSASWRPSAVFNPTSAPASLPAEIVHLPQPAPMNEMQC